MYQTSSCLGRVGWRTLIAKACEKTVWEDANVPYFDCADVHVCQKPLICMLKMGVLCYSQLYLDKAD